MLHLPLRELQSMQKGDDYFADTLLLDLADGSSADHCSFFHSSWGENIDICGMSNLVGLSRLEATL